MGQNHGKKYDHDHDDQTYLINYMNLVRPVTQFVSCSKFDADKSTNIT